MRIIEATNKAEWDAFVTGAPAFSFFQSWNWGEVQRAIGRPIYRLVVVGPRAWLGTAQVLVVPAKKGTYLNLRHGPVLHDWRNLDVLDLLLSETRKIAKKEKACFLRVSPLIPHTGQNITRFASRGFQTSSLHIMDAVYDWVLDLPPDERDLLGNMRKTTRNLIRRAEREGVLVRSTQDPKDLPTFHRLHHETMERQEYVSYPDLHLSREFEIFAAEDEARLWFSEYKNYPISTALIIYYGNQAFYHWAGRSSAHEKIPGPTLLLWESIKDAKRRGFSLYNLWGIAPPDRLNHPWAGLTMFKQGFGGRLIHFLHAQDLPLSKRYWLTFVAETLRKWQKGL